MARVAKMEDQERCGTEKVGAGSAPVTGGSVDERQLVRRAQKGCKAAFESLVQGPQHRVFAVARGILKRHEDVEDIAQQVFVKAYFSLKRFDQRAAFSTWLYKITVNECWDLLRRKKARPLVYESELSEEQARQVITAGDDEDTGPAASGKTEARVAVERPP